MILRIEKHDNYCEVYGFSYEDFIIEGIFLIPIIGYKFLVCKVRKK